MYKNFSEDTFLAELIDNDVNNKVLQEKNLEEAVRVLHRELKYLADKLAPLKIVQIHKNYQPALSPETKELIKRRDSMRKQLQGTRDLQLETQYKELVGEVKKRVKTDKKNHHLAKYETDQTPKGAWKAARSILGQDSTTSPRAIELEDGSWVNNQKQMADIFAKHYNDKVKKLRSQKRRQPNIDPVVRLERALSQRETFSPSDLPPDHEPEGATQTQNIPFRL